jgi:hypothetical protein
MGRQSTGGRDCGRWEDNRLAKKWKSEVNPYRTNVENRVS